MCILIEKYVTLPLLHESSCFVFKDNFLYPEEQCYEVNVKEVAPHLYKLRPKAETLKDVASLFKNKRFSKGYDSV